MFSYIKSALFYLCLPFCRLYIRLRFKSYWALRQYLQGSPRRHRLLWRTLDHWFRKQGSYVGRTAKIAGMPYFPHGCTGVFISKDAVIGRDAVIFQQVTVGSNTLPDSRRPGSPVIGDGVYIGAGAKIIGGITVGDCCRIGANAVVVHDMPSHCVAVCAPTRIIQKEALDNTFRVNIDGTQYVSQSGRLIAKG